MNSVSREGGQSVLSSEPTRLLPTVGREDGERLAIETRERLNLAKDGSQLRELVTIGAQFSR